MSFTLGLGIGFHVWSSNSAPDSLDGWKVECGTWNDSLGSLDSLDSPDSLDSLFSISPLSSSFIEGRVAELQPERVT